MSHPIRYLDALDGLPDVRPGKPSKELAQAVERVVSKGVAASTKLEVGARAAHTAMLNAALLSKEEEGLAQFAPSGSARYQAIADAYTLLAVHEIGRLR